MTDNTRSIAVTTEQTTQLVSGAISLKAQSAALTISTPEQLKAAIEFGGNVKKMQKAMKEDMDKILAPAKAVVEEIKSRYKPNMDMLAEVEAEVKQKVGAFQAEEMRKQQEAEAAAQREREEQALREAEEVKRMEEEQRQRIEAEAAERKAKLEAEGKTDEAAKVDEQTAAQVAATSAAAGKIIDQRIEGTVMKSQVTNTVKSGEFSSGMSKRWTYEVVDVTKLPAEYLDYKPGLILAAVNSGTREIPGVRIFQKDVVSFR